MLLREYQEVTELDSQIIDLQNELVNLYRKRAAFVGDAPSNTTSDKPDWVGEQYELLAKTWAKYGLAIPKLSTLKARLSRAEKLIAKLTDADSRLTGNLAPVLVPPAELLDLPRMRSQQRFIKLTDYISPEIPEIKAAKAWRLLVAYIAAEGLDVGTAETILSNNLHKIAGYDTRGLGVAEYQALTLQSPVPLDAMGWTLLLKDAKDTVTSATFMHGQYRFDVDDANGLIGEDVFRPAVEIKAGK